MSTQARCPVCGRKLTVRSDDRLPRHWWSERERIASADQCEGSLMGIRYWPTTAGIRHQHPNP